MILYTIILFVILTPSVVFQFPKKGNKYTVAFVHGLIFALLFHFTQNMLTLNTRENITLFTDDKCTIYSNKKMAPGQRYRRLEVRAGPPPCVKAN
jgi:hypothetical protein